MFNNSKFLLLTFLIALSFPGCKDKTNTLLFVGSFTEGKPASGIKVFQFDNNSGTAQLVYEHQNIINPSFLSLSPSGEYLFSVVESQLQIHGKVVSFAIDSTSGSLTLLTERDAGGRNPVHLAAHPTENLLINSNYTDAGLSVFEYTKDGALNPYSQLLTFKDSSIVEGRQDEAHIHSSNFSPDGKYLFAQDLGGDKIRVFNVIQDSTGPRLTPKHPISTEPGSGPRHFTFHPDERYAYGISELGGTVTAYTYDRGQLVYLEDYSSYSKKQEIYRAADIHISPDGKFLYASNRGPDEDSIAIFSIASNGRLSLVGHEPTHGEHPRNFAIDPSGNFLLVANQFTDNIVVFERNSNTGKLTKLDFEIEVDNPSSIVMRNYAQ